MADAEINDRVGEVIEAGTAGFTAQCYELYQAPPLGSLVKTSEGEVSIYGIVCHATTSGIETGRRPVARGKDALSEEDIYRDSPQLEKLLRSEFEVLVAGHRSGDVIHHYLPARPAHIHSFVYECSPGEVKEFSRTFGFLASLVNASLEVPVEEIISAALRQMAAVQDDRHSFLVAAGKELAVLLGGEYNRLRNILGRMSA